VSDRLSYAATPRSGSSVKFRVPAAILASGVWERGGSRVVESPVKTFAIPIIRPLCGRFPC